MEIALIIDVVGYILLAVVGYYSFKAFNKVKNIKIGYQGPPGSKGDKGDPGKDGKDCKCCPTLHESSIRNTNSMVEEEGVKGTQGLRGDDPGGICACCSLLHSAFIGKLPLELPIKNMQGVKGDDPGPRGMSGPSPIKLSDLRIGNYVHYNGFRWIVSGVHSPAPSEYPYYDGEELVDLFDGAGFSTIRVKDIQSIPINDIPITVFHAKGITVTIIHDLHKLQNLYFHLHNEELDVDSFDFGDPIN